MSEFELQNEPTMFVKSITYGLQKKNVFEGIDPEEKKRRRAKGKRQKAARKAQRK